MSLKPPRPHATTLSKGGHGTYQAGKIARKKPSYMQMNKVTGHRKLTKSRYKKALSAFDARRSVNLRFGRPPGA